MTVTVLKAKSSHKKSTKGVSARRSVDYCLRCVTNRERNWKVGISVLDLLNVVSI